MSCLSIIADVTRLEQRPKLLGLFGGKFTGIVRTCKTGTDEYPAGVFAVSSVIGPLL